MNNIQELIERLNRLLDEDDDSVDDIWERTIYDSITSLESMQQRIEELEAMNDKVMDWDVAQTLKMIEKIERLDAALEEISLGVVAPMDFAKKARAGE